MAKKIKTPTIQHRVRDNEMLENFFRHLGNISIDLDEEEVEIEATFPDDSYPWGSGNYSMSLTVDLSDEEGEIEYPQIRDAIKRLVKACHEAMIAKDPEYDPDRCERCVKGDCCAIARIHLTDAERIRVLEHLGLADTPENSEKYFEEDDDLAGYYRHVMRHENEACVFLDRSGPVARCGIYEARPRVCREYDAGYCTEATELLAKTPALHV